MRKCLIRFWLFAAVTVLTADGKENFFTDGGFEAWNNVQNLPDGPAYRWTLPKGGQKGFAIFESSAAEKHSGERSLHLKDTDRSKTNQSLHYVLTKNEVAELAKGQKVLRFSVWVKIVDANKAKNTGISLWLKTTDGKTDSNNASIDSATATDWRLLKTKIRVPENARQIIASFNCASGFFNTAEAYFDDAVLTDEESLADTATDEHIGSDLPAAPRKPTLTPEAEAYLRPYRDFAPVTDDGHTRPAVVNGTWRDRTGYRFFIGPWIYNRTGMDWNPGANPLKINHPGYTTAPGKEVWDCMAFTSAQVSAAHTLPGQVAYGLKLPKNWQKQEQEITNYYHNFQDIPLALDFAFGFHKSIDAATHKTLDQRNGAWHEFIPLCPEHPDGGRYYRDYITNGAKAALRNRSNIFVYEIFNESSYDCTCRFNTAEFAKKMRAKYGTIAKANAAWGTIFDNFSEVAEMSIPRKFPNLYLEWADFLGTRYAEVVSRQINAIKEFDKRPNVYFCEMCCAGVPPGHGLIDYRKVAEISDVLATEGGWHYGIGKAPTARNGMEAVVMSSGVTHWFNLDFYQGLAKGKKPVVNHEHYCWRGENGQRVPSRREDMITSLWMEIMHGSSGNYTYCWDKRSFDWKTFEEAKKNVIDISYKSSSLLNPYNWPPEQLDAFKVFTSELAPFKEQILPFPRTRATVALFFSYPSHWLKDALNPDGLKNWYSALLFNQYPLRIVFDRDLKEGLDKDITALVVPFADYLERGSAEAIAEFAAAGGTVVADARAFRFDEFGAPLAKMPESVIRLDAAADSRGLLKALDGKARKFLTLEPADAQGVLTQTDAQIIDRGDFKFINAVDFGDPAARLGKIRLHLAGEDAAKRYFVHDVGNRRLIMNGQDEAWSVADLRAGVTAILPAQERLALVVSARKMDGFTAFDAAARDAKFRELRTADEAHVKKVAAQIAAAREKGKLDRRYDGVNAARCEAVDLRHAANMAFKDEFAGDKQGGWFDQGNNDFAAMPLGAQTFAGVPFTVIDPRQNHNKGCIVLHGNERDFFPKEVTGIKIGRPAKYLYFLHAAGWDTRGKVLTYRIHYADGSATDIDINGGQEIGGWWNNAPVPNAKIAVEAANGAHSPITAYCYRWRNPLPKNVIVSLDVITGEPRSVPAVIAVTVEKP